MLVSGARRREDSCTNAAYIRWGVTNGIVEGLHNKVRVITRRAFGFHSAAALIGMIMLCCTNIELHPPRLSLAM